MAKPALAVSTGDSGYFGATNTIDVRAYGALCDGSTDDAAAFSAAYVALNAGGGGTLLVPAGKTCMISTDVAVKSSVNLLCEPGGTLKATSDASFTLGMFSWFVTANNSGVEGCTFDLNGNAVAAMWTSGEDVVVRRTRVKNGATSNGSTWDMVRFGCTTSGSTATCRFSDNRIDASGTAGAKERCLDSAGSASVLIENNSIVGCDTTGIYTIAADPQVIGNYISVSGTSATGLYLYSYGHAVSNRILTSGASAIAIDVGGADAVAENNKISTSGTSAIGIQLSAPNQGGAFYNRLTMTGTSSTAFKVTAAGSGGSQIEGNVYNLSATSGGSIGVYAASDYEQIVGNFGAFGAAATQTHVVVAGQQILINGNQFNGGAYGVVPSQASAAELGAGINVTISENRFIGQIISQVIGITGWLVHGNYLAWVGQSNSCATAVANVQVGDVRTFQTGTSHMNITGNVIHNQCSSAPGVKFNDQEPICDGGTNKWQTCSASNSTQCPGTGSSCLATDCRSAGVPYACCTGNHTNAGCTCCATGPSRGVQIVGNHFLLNSSSGNAGVDLSAAVSSVASLTDVTIDGNTFDMGASALGIKCSASHQSRLTNVIAGWNAYTGDTPASGDTNKGRLDLNCTPSMVNDAMTSLAWLPAARCNAGSPYAIWDIPSTNAATSVCNGSNYPRGYLSYADSADTYAYTSLSLGASGTYQFFVRPKYLVNAKNTLSTRWAFAYGCVTNASSGGGDPSWSSDFTLDVAYGNTSGVIYTPSSYSTIGAATCPPGGMLNLRIKRVGSNSTAGQDDQTNPSLLAGIELYARRQN